MEESKFTIPRILLSTNQGALSCMIPQHLSFLNFNPGIHFSFAGLVDNRAILRDFAHATKSDHPLRDYFGLTHIFGKFKEKGLECPLIYLSFDQNGENSIIGSDKNGNVEVKTGKGKRKLSLKEYIEEVELLKPSLVGGMHQHIDSKSGHKKVKRAARHSLQLLDSLVQEHPELSRQKLLAPLIYSDDAVHLAKYVEQVKALISKVRGVLLLNTDKISWKQKIYFIDSIYQDDQLESKERCIVLSGEGRPLDILLGSLVGIRSFQCRYPLTLAEQGKALLLPQVHLQKQKTSSLEQVIEGAKELPSEIVLNLYSKQYFSDKNTLLGNECEEGTHTWQKVSKAYIHHLLDCHEMNGHILLAQHNLKMYGLLLDRIDTHMKHGTLLAYAEQFIRKLKTD